MDEGDIEAQRAEHQPHGAADQEGREQHAEARHGGDRPFAGREMAEVDVQRAGKEQEAQHTLHQGLLEVDLQQRGAQALAEAEGGEDRVDAKGGERGGERDYHQPDGGRQAQEMMIEVTEHGGQRQQNRDDVQQLLAHGPLPAPTPRRRHRPSSAAGRGPTSPRIHRRARIS